jgi:hypothetical protein
MANIARQALTRIGGFFAKLRKTAEQLDRWYRILSQALKKYLRARILAATAQIRRTVSYD